MWGKFGTSISTTCGNKRQRYKGRGGRGKREGWREDKGRERGREGEGGREGEEDKEVHVDERRERDGGRVMKK